MAASSPFADLARTAAAVGATRSKNAKRDLLAAYLRELPDADLPPATAFFAGRPLVDPAAKLGIGWVQQGAALAAASGADPDEIRRRLIEQVTGTVRWRESVAYMAAHGVTRFFEIGAGKVLSGLVKRIADGAVGVSIGGPNDLAAARDALAASA